MNIINTMIIIKRIPTIYFPHLCPGLVQRGRQIPSGREWAPQAEDFNESKAVKRQKHTKIQQY